MPARLYYWVKGAPANRPGGPWWYRDFVNVRTRERFLEQAAALFHRWARTDGKERVNAHSVQPPTNAILREGGPT